jgi:hypothetical protein
MRLKILTILVALAATPTAALASEDGAANRDAIRSMISAKVSSEIGAQWVPTALRIAQIESGMQCNPRGNTRHHGVFQVGDPNRFGISPAGARTCAGGISAGVAHMAACLKMGASNARQMMVCHNAGNPFARRVERAYRVALR